ncbi:MAG TPA: PaaI family thioesterase [Thermoanaerobaculia bacterium]|nr:PaaI family thioesterase [Thermoanaerobaculia bacterium]
MPADEHFRKLERMYLGAPINAAYAPTIEIGEGWARVEIPVRPELFHGAGAVHGAVYFKVLDDAAFFAANSLLEDTFVVTTSFHIHLTRPVSEGRIVAVGRIVQASRRLSVAEAHAEDAAGRLLAKGSGTFVSSGIPLGETLGYR